MAKVKHGKVINIFDLVDDPDNPRAIISKLDPEEFHVPASDGKGHDTRFQFRCMKQIRAMVAEIIQTRQFPYQSDSELMRHALIRHLKWLTDQGYIGANTIFQIQAVSEVAKDDEMHQGFMSSLELLQERVNYHRSRGGNGSERAVEDMVGKVVELVDGMPEGRWKELYKEEIINRYGKEMIKKWGTT